MDRVAQETASPITEKNLSQRLEALMIHPAVLADMIVSYQKIQPNIIQQSTDQKSHRYAGGSR
jgi:hypothetical protein